MSSNPNTNTRRLSRRSFLSNAASTAFTGAISSSLPARALEPKKPLNVLFFMSDDMRVELGSYGSQFGARTPNLDALARRGVRFDRNYCQFPLCGPSRASLLTGRKPTSTGILGNRGHFRDVHPELVSLPQLFREHGYATLRTGKIFHGGVDDPKAWTEGGGNENLQSIGNPGKTKQVSRGPVPPQPANVKPPLPLDIQQAPNSDRIVVLEGYGEGHPDYQVADKAIEYLNRYKNQPFFLGCGFSKPHSPPTAPQRFLDLYPAKKIKLPHDFAAWPTVPEGIPPAAIRMLNADLFIGRGASESEAREVIAAYLAAISWADWNVGRVVRELDRLGLRDQTVIVFVADHGYQLGEKGKWSKAGSLFEMGTRVPLIIHAPGAHGNGKTSFHTVQSLDLYPTLAELCRLETPGGLQGNSLAPLLNRPSVAWTHPAFSIWSEDGKTVHGTAIRQEQWRYVEFGEGGQNGRMLFDLQADPSESHNLAHDPSKQALVASLSRQIAEYGPLALST
ncbi:sulfatase [Terriglobus tenax]|uniref:sulfatase n=1 Tax=Terriglobus tenax TaxID=1111115 RepID=UPI0021E0AE64|nr:sulfatase [Terriglobus tenax]